MKTQSSSYRRHSVLVMLLIIPLTALAGCTLNVPQQQPPQQPPQQQPQQQQPRTQQQPVTSERGRLAVVDQNGNSASGTYTATFRNGVQTGLTWTVDGVDYPFNTPAGGWANPRTSTLTTRSVQMRDGSTVVLRVTFQTSRSGTWSGQPGHHGTFTATQ